MPPEHEFRSLMLRLLLCLATAAIISITAYICAWLDYRGHVAWYFRHEQVRTRHFLEQLRENIERYRETTGKLPASLADLEVVKQREVLLDEAGQAADGWGRPVHYEVEDGGYQLYSLGRDDLPGGTEEDVDLYAGKVDAANESFTLWEFTICPGTQGIQFCCFLAGVLAFPLCLLGVRRGATNRLSPVKVLVVHGVTAAFAILAAVLISVLHLPSGH